MAFPIMDNNSIDGFAIVYSETPNDDLWNNILRYSDLYILKKTLTLDDDESIFVSMSIKQAYEYYLSGVTASLQTKPLYIYYCFLNLAKALICIKNKETIFKYHGLCETKFITKYENSSDILKYETKVNDGIFRRLAEIFGNDIQKNQILTFQNFIDNALEINIDVGVYFGISCNIAPVQIINHSPASMALYIHNEWKDDVDNHSKLAEDFTLSTDECNPEKRFVYYKTWGEVNQDYTTMRNIIKKHVEFSVLNHDFAYLNVNPIEKRMHNAISYWGIAYLLSNIARYEPIAISKMIFGNDSIYSLLYEICNKSLRIFPNLVYNMIVGSDIRFSNKIN